MKTHKLQQPPSFRLPLLSSSLLLAAGLVISMVPQASAQNRTWTGNATGFTQASRAANWVEGAPAIDTSYNVIYSSGAYLGPNTSTNYNTTGFGFSSLSISDSDRSYTLAGNAASLTGNVTISSGSHNFNVNITTVTNSTWDIATGAVLSRGGSTLGLAADQTITKTGGGTLIWASSNTNNDIIGTVRIGAGNMTLANDNALLNATLDMNTGDAGTLGFGTLTAPVIGALTGSRGILLQNDNAAAVTLTVGSTGAGSAARTYSGIFSGSGGITKAGTYTQTLTGNSTFTGQFRISNGVVEFNRLGNTGEDSPIGRNGVAIIGAGNNVTRLVYLGSGESTNKQFQIGSGGVSAGAGSRINNDGSGALVLTNAQFNSADSGATVNLTRTLTLGGNYTGGANRIEGAIVDNNGTNPIGLTIAGTSSGVVWQLGGANTYTGPTQVTSGTLLVTGLTSATSTVTVASGATLGGNGTIGGATTISGNLQPGNSPGILTFGSSLTLNSTATTTMEINGSAVRGTDYDGINVGTALTYGGNLTLNFGATFGGGSYTFALFDFDSQSGSFANVVLTGSYTGALLNNGSGVWGLTSGDNTWTYTQADGVLGLVVIPEPSTWALLAGFLVSLIAFRRMRRSR